MDKFAAKIQKPTFQKKIKRGTRQIKIFFCNFSVFFLLSREKSIPLHFNRKIY